MSDLLKALDEIEVRAKAATPGPWFVGPYRYGTNKDKVSNRGAVLCSEALPAIRADSPAKREYLISRGPRLLGPGQWDYDADFIAHARTDVPRLIRALRVAVGALEVIGCTTSNCGVEVGPGDIRLCDTHEALSAITKELANG